MTIDINDSAESDFNNSSIDFEEVPFRKEELQNAYLLRNTSFKRDILEELNYERAPKNSGMSPAAKRAMRTFIQNYLNPVHILANNSKRSAPVSSILTGGMSTVDELKSARIKFEIGLISLTTSMNKLDVMNPFWVNFRQNVTSHYRAIITRTIGPERERIINDEIKQVSKQEVIQRSDHQKSAVQKEKRGLLRF